MDEYTLTKWYNPTQETIRFSVFVGPEGNKNAWRTVEMGPGQFKDLPSEWDHVIQETNSVGKVTGGKAPQLLKNYTPPAVAEAPAPAKSSK